MTPTARGAAVPTETFPEIASGLVLGGSPLPAVAGAGREGDALAALEAAVLPALLRPPCVVAFSGGTDSSVVLAVALSLARRLGLPEPVAFSWRFRGAPAAEESDWQQRVVASLGLREWEVRVAEEGELDVVGPQAREVLLRHGVRHPANLHLHATPTALARGGSLLTGAGGDQVLSGWRRPENRTFTRRLKDQVPPALRVTLRDLLRRELPWLRRDVAARVLRGRLRDQADEPVELARRVRWHAGRRDLTLTLANLRRLGEPYDVEVVAPLADHGFVQALAQELGAGPAPRRAALVAAIAREAAPPVVWQARRKARFGEVFLAQHARTLAQAWDGAGLDPRVVDADALARLWSRWPVPLGTAGLLQEVLLAGLRDEGAVRTAARRGDGG